MMVFGLALQHGVDVDRSALQMIMNKSFGYLTDLDRAVQGSHVIDPVQSLAHAMVPAASLGLRGTASTGAYARLIARRQLADGHWLVFDDRPPQAFSPFSATAYAVRALQLFLPDSMMQERQERIERARSWLRTNRPFDTEDRTFQLFGLRWAGAEPESMAKARKDLLALQQSDGGWSQLPGRPSDAYATGETLAALHQAAGLPVKIGRAHV